MLVTLVHIAHLTNFSFPTFPLKGRESLHIAKFLYRSAQTALAQMDPSLRWDDVNTFLVALNI